MHHERLNEPAAQSAQPVTAATARPVAARPAPRGQPLQRRFGNQVLLRAATLARQASNEHDDERDDAPQAGLDASIRRRVMVGTGPGTPLRELNAAGRQRFLRTNRASLGDSRERRLAARVLDDMADTSDALNFDNEAELVVEVRKRVVTSVIMQESQRSVGGLIGFGYPWRGESRYYGPRVNYAARTYWTPVVPDGYARRDAATRRAIDAARGDRAKAAITGDPGGGYSFTLTPDGRSDPYQALVTLFTRQPAHRRTLIHCDYLVSLVQFRAFADSLGRAEFNRRVQAGEIRFILRWNGFDDINIRAPGARGQSMQQVTPSRRGDLVIGDHVYFFNHPAYDPLIRVVGGVWRLENAVLVDRRSGTDYFLGHGSGYRDEAGIKGKLLEQFNLHADQALRLVRATRRGNPAERVRADAQLRTLFPALVKRGSDYYIVGNGVLSTPVDIRLRRLRLDEIPGLYNPRTYVSRASPGVFYKVRRPIESR